MAITRNFRTYLDPQDNKIAIRVRWNNKKNNIVIYLGGIKWDPDRWDGLCQKAKANTSFGNMSARQVNSIIEQKIKQLNDIFVFFESKNELPTSEAFKNALNHEIDEENIRVPRELDKIYEDFMNTVSLEKTWTSKVHYKYQQVWTHLHKAVPHVSITNLNKDTMLQLKKWYLDQGYSNVTINKQIKMLKAIFKWAAANGNKIDTNVLNFSCNLKTIEKTVTFLKFQELMSFYTFELSCDRFSRVRDLFCFMSFTSLRYSDLCALKWENIEGDRINLVTKKTYDRISIPLIKYAQEILKKYETSERKGLVFKVPANQIMNDYLKEAAKEAGLDRMITEYSISGNNRKEITHPFYDTISCHDARRTFVCCSLAMGISAETVMSCTGHANYRSMKPYIEVVDDTQKKELERWSFQTKTTATQGDDKNELVKLLSDIDPEQKEAIVQMIKAMKKK